MAASSPSAKLMNSGTTVPPPSASRDSSMHPKNGSSWPMAGIPAGIPAAVSSARPGTRLALPAKDKAYADPRPTVTRSQASSGFCALTASSSLFAAAMASRRHSPRKRPAGHPTGPGSTAKQDCPQTIEPSVQPVSGKGSMQSPASG
eukprot:scaffold11990_cov107-Isochrysis_galbana.AAC.4